MELALMDSSTREASCSLALGAGSGGLEEVNSVWVLLGVEP